MNARTTVGERSTRHKRRSVPVVKKGCPDEAPVAQKSVCGPHTVSRRGSGTRTYCPCPGDLRTPPALHRGSHVEKGDPETDGCDSL